MRREIDYAYAVARIKAMENKLLKSEDYEALIDADPDMLIDVLAGFGYPSADHVLMNENNKADTDPLSAYTGLLSSLFSSTVRNVMSFSPEPDVLNCFLFPADYSNAKKCVKYIVKDNLPSEQGKPVLSENGCYKPDVLLDAFIKKDFRSLDKTIEGACRSAFDELSQSGSSRNSDIILDKACYAAMCSSVSRCSLLTKVAMRKYLDIYADWKNLLAALRIKESGSDPSLMDKAYLLGSISKDHFVGIIEGNEEPFKGTKYGKCVEAFFDKFGTQPDHERSIAEYEQLADAFIDAQLLKDRNEPYRINALLAYIASIKREISIIRLIVVGKRARISADRIREMVSSSRSALEFVKGK